MSDEAALSSDSIDGAVPETPAPDGRPEPWGRRESSERGPLASTGTTA